MVEEDKKKLLFVCSGNSCLSPMAMIVGGYDGRAITDSAAGNMRNSHFVVEKGTSIHAINAIKKRYSEGSPEYNRISTHSPKLLSQELVEWADLVIFLGERFRANAVQVFPQYQSKFMLYCIYCSKDASKRGALMYDAPDPIDGQNWIHYYGTSCPWPGTVTTSYLIVLDSMINDFQPSLDKRIWPSQK